MPVPELDTSELIDNAVSATDLICAGVAIPIEPRTSPVALSITALVPASQLLSARRRIPLH